MAADQDFQTILNTIEAAIRPSMGEGEVASYIPQLAEVDPHQFGMALCTVDGETYTVGQADTPFSIQSISKAFTLTLAIRLEGEKLWRRVGKEPSGSAFNSLVQLEYESGIPRNPFINAGALVITDVILQHLDDAKSTVLNFMRELTGDDSIEFDTQVADSEAAVGYRNVAMANFIKSFGNLNHRPHEVLDAYFHHCSMAMSCAQLSKAALFMANRGVCPSSGDKIVSVEQSRYLNALMLTSGTYDAAGDFAYRVGLPAKSGVGGGIMAVMPNRFAATVWCPGLDSSGNSVVGLHALQLLSQLTGWSIFG